MSLGSRRVPRGGLATLLLVVASGLAAWCLLAMPLRAAPDSTSSPGQRYFDSLKALPDSLLVPPGSMPDVDRRQALDFMRRMFRSPDSTYVGPDERHRTDDEMMRTFQAHRREFDRLVAMFREDSAVDRIVDPTWGWQPSFLPHPVPEKRWKEYLKLLAVTRVRMLVKDEENRSPTILLRTTTTHTFDRKGYAYSTTPLEPLVDHETTIESSALRVYRRLAPRWYIYFQAIS